MSIWSKPCEGTVKVNVKGFFLRSQMRSSVGCIMRDSNGNWIKGCKSMIGLVVPVTAELWAIWYGLKMAWESGNEAVVLECENEEAVDQVLNPDEYHDMFDLVLMIRKIMSEAWEICDIVHISSSANLPATALANEAINDHGGLEDVVEPPSSIQGLLLADKMA